MKPRRIVGLVLLLAVIALTAYYQWWGGGLVVTTTPPTPPQEAAQGITTVQVTTYDAAILPLMLVGSIGLILLLLPQGNRHRNHSDFIEE